MPTTANKGYSVPTPGTESGTWGADLNANTFATIDTNLGGVVSITLSNINVILTAPQAQNLCVRLVGTMTGNVLLTAAYIGMMIIENATTGAFTVALSNGLGASANVPQGQASFFVSDASNGCRVVAQDIPSGTLMTFAQTAAPVGWTKNTTHNDKALRVVNGAASSGGLTPFTTVFAARTISVANMPTHNHGVTDPGHIHPTSIANTSPFTASGSGANFALIGVGSTGSSTTGLTIQNNGSGTAMDFAVQYVDVILASRN
jgi:hypothetical protein